MKTLTVISPVYNEEEAIEIFYQALKAVLLKLEDKYEWTILFVLDRSPDQSLQILKQLAVDDPRLRILTLSSRFGHQMSLVAGMDHCDSEIVIMMDSDLQHPPDLIPEMLARYENGYDIVFTKREDTPDISFLKRTTSKLFYRLINYVSDVPISESAADFRLISRKVLKVFQSDIRERNQFLRGLFNWVGFNSCSVPFFVRKRVAGKSKYSLARMFRLGFNGVVSFSKSPLQMAGFLGLLFALLGFCYAVFTVLQYFIEGSLPTGWATLIILISVFSGIQLMFLGALGEYIGAIFDEVKKRPLYVVDEKINFNRD